MKILVTGATGNVGSLVVTELLKRGAEVRALVRKQPKAGKLPAGVEVAIGDLLDPVSVEKKLFENNAGLEAKTVFEYLQRESPGRFQDGQLRTLQRRVKGWRATDGPSREVFFAQQHLPGRLCASDFTHMEELGVTIQGQSFPHLIYHFVLTYSNWETGTVCFSESFESLSEGLQNAL